MTFCMYLSGGEQKQRPREAPLWDDKIEVFLEQNLISSCFEKQENYSNLLGFFRNVRTFFLAPHFGNEAKLFANWLGRRHFRGLPHMAMHLCPSPYLSYILEVVSSENMFSSCRNFLFEQFIYIETKRNCISMRIFKGIVFLYRYQQTLQKTHVNYTSFDFKLHN